MAIKDIEKLRAILAEAEALHQSRTLNREAFERLRMEAVEACGEQQDALEPLFNFAEDGSWIDAANELEAQRAPAIALPTAAELVARTGMSLVEAEYSLDVARGEWAGDVLEVDELGVERPAHRGANWRPESDEQGAHPS